MKLRGVTQIELYNSQEIRSTILFKNLKQLRKEMSLIVGHSNTVDDIVNKLCGRTKSSRDLKDSEYDNLLYCIQEKGNNYKFEKKNIWISSNPELMSVLILILILIIREYQYSLSPLKFSNSFATAVRKVAPRLPSTIR